MLISQSYVKRCFVNFLVIFGDVWKEIVFLKGLVKISIWTTKQSPDNLGCSCVGVNCLLVFQK